MILLAFLLKLSCKILATCRQTQSQSWVKKQAPPHLHGSEVFTPCPSILMNVRYDQIVVFLQVNLIRHCRRSVEECLGLSPHSIRSTYIERTYTGTCTHTRARAHTHTHAYIYCAVEVPGGTLFHAGVEGDTADHDPYALCDCTHMYVLLTATRQYRAIHARTAQL